MGTVRGTELTEFRAYIGRTTTTVKGQLQFLLLIAGQDAESAALVAMRHPQEMVTVNMRTLDFSDEEEDQDELFEMLDGMGSYDDLDDDTPAFDPLGLSDDDEPF